MVKVLQTNGDQLTIERDVQINVKVSPAEKREIEKLAEVLDLDISKLFRQLFRRALREHQAQKA